MLRRLPALAVLLPGLLLPLLPVPAEAAPPARPIRYQAWSGDAAFATGKFRGTQLVKGRLVVARAASQATVGGVRYDVARWVSPAVRPGFDLTELVPSWTARTRGRTFLQVEVSGVTASGTRTGWDTISRWAAGDRHVRRTSFGSQPDGGASVAYDTWLAPSGVRTWKLRVSLFRPTGTTRTPKVGTVGAMVSRLPSVTSVTSATVSKPTGLAAGKVLPVPEYSQMIHRSEYPQYNGGAAWCSPTSVSMVLGYYGKLPPPSAYSWVNPSYPDRFVAHAARLTYDYSYGGTGTWPFNAAYAASRTGRAFVTRLRSLREAERFVAAGIPVVASISYSSGQLTGAAVSSTPGHLVVIVGFTKAGNVVVNDPAADYNADVRRRYDRTQFESAWLRRYSSGGSMKGSGGLAYVIHDADHPLPARNGSGSW